MIGSFRLFPEDRINNLRLNFIIFFCTTQKRKIGGVFGDGFIQFQVFNNRYILIQFHKFDKFGFDESSIVPCIHANGDKTAQNDGKPPAIKEFNYVSIEKS